MHPNPDQRPHLDELVQSCINLRAEIGLNKDQSIAEEEQFKHN